MSYDTIKIHRQYPVINGYVQLPNNLEKNRTADTVDNFLTNNADSVDVLFDISPSTGSAFGGQRLVEMPGVQADHQYIDPVTT